MTRFRVTAWLDAETSVQEVSKIFEGLHRLHRLGEIDLQIRARSGAPLWPRVVQLTIGNSSGEVREIAIDLSDQRDLVDQMALDRADPHFKRSFWSDALPPHHKHKVEPFGLNNPAIGLAAAFRMLRSRLATGRSPAGVARDARHLLALPSPAAFEASPDESAEMLVLFQTRLWPSDDPAVLAMNDQRASLIRALRTAFGARFIGGAIQSEFANKHYPDLVTSLPSGMRSYPKLVRRALVGVYSGGLHGSVAFKMSEYLAAARCIVAVPPETVLPQPLREGSNYLPFEGPETCIAQCERLLSDPAKAEHMRRANSEYYRSAVEPAAQLLRILHSAFDRTSST